MTIADIDKRLAELGRDKKQSEGWSLAERLHRLVSGGCFGAHLCNECNTELLEAAAALEREAKALKALRAVLVLHSPYTIYTECDHVHDPDVEDDGAVDIPDVGRTCAKLHDICAHCCTDAAGEQSEECACEHMHVLDKLICLTAATLEDAAI